MGLSDMRQRLDIIVTCDINSTCDIGENKQQGHATLPFLKIDMRHWEPPIKGLRSTRNRDRSIS